jgi:HlyD family secretion protein
MKKPALSSVVVVAIFAFFGVSIVRSVLAGSPADVRPADIDKAHKEVLPKKGIDERTTMPTEKGLVGGNGQVEPLERETNVAAAVPGVVAAVLVEEGQFVEVGTPLIRLENSIEAAALAAAEADVAGAQAEMKRLTKGSRQEEVDAALAEAEAAKARAELSASSLARIERLGAGGAASVDELDRARSQAKSDQQNFALSDARRRQTLAGFREEDVLASRARLRAAEARRNQASASLDRLTIKAPITGQVLQLKFRAGEYYQPGTNPLVVMGDTRTLRVRMDVEERDVSKVVVGASAFVTADAFPGRRFPGKVIEIGKRMGRKNLRTDDPAERIDTKILEVRVELDDAKDLVPGLRVMSFLQAS